MSVDKQNNKGEIILSEKEFREGISKIETMIRALFNYSSSDKIINSVRNSFTLLAFYAGEESIKEKYSQGGEVRDKVDEEFARFELLSIILPRLSPSQVGVVEDNLSIFEEGEHSKIMEALVKKFETFDSHTEVPQIIGEVGEGVGGLMLSPAE